jgi:hypothetical protein
MEVGYAGGGLSGDIQKDIGTFSAMIVTTLATKEADDEMIRRNSKTARTYYRPPEELCVYSVWNYRNWYPA